MSSQSAATQGKDLPATINVNSAKNQLLDRVRERIAARAYELYQSDGNRHGQDMRHWLQAELELLGAAGEIRESSGWFTVNVALEGFLASEVQVNVEPQYAVIAAEKQQASASEPGSSSHVSEAAVFTRAKWPDEVDASTASAYLKNGILSLTVKRAVGAKAGVETRRSSQKTQ